MAKTIKIDDVKRPDKVAPSSTSRPVIVTNRPTMKNDPMVTGSGDEAKPEEAAETLPMTHGPKIIAPVSPDLLAGPDESEEEPKDTGKKAGEEKGEDEERPQVSASVDDQPEPKEELSERPEDKVEPASPSPEHEEKETEPAVSEIKLTGIERDPEAAVTAEEAAEAEAKAQREQEIESIIASGKYAVPINAVQRRRSRTATTLLFILAIVLAVVLADVVADVGLVHVPSSVPHTHFFSKY